MLTVLAYILLIPIIVFGCICDDMTNHKPRKKKKRHHF